MTIPLPIETERLLIRPFEAGDVDAMAEVYGDPEVMRAGAVVGDIGCGVYAPTGEPELGYTLAAGFWGRGYALEAARACIEAAFANLPQRRLVARVESGNDRSLRLAERLEMRPVETIAIDGRPHVLLALERA
ncbi:MAG TPA: GNAT family N-acetyltransferase [Gaiellaceae bacterium]